MASSYLYFLVPIVAVVIGLKCCLLCWRIHYNQQRRRIDQAREAEIQRAAIARSQAARLAAITRAAPPGSFAQIVTRSPNGSQQVYLVPTSMAQRPRAPAHMPRTVAPPTRPRPSAPLPRTIIITPDDLGLLSHACRSVDPNLPPTYDQAVTGKDKSVKVEEGKAMENVLNEVEEEEEEESPPTYSNNDDDDVRPLLP